MYGKVLSAVSNIVKTLPLCAVSAGLITQNEPHTHTHAHTQTHTHTHMYTHTMLSFHDNKFHDNNSSVYTCIYVQC